MAYQVGGLPRTILSRYLGASAEELEQLGAMRVFADADRGYPCRITLEDARAGESLILCHHVSHDVATPYRSAYAIYFREIAQDIQPYVDRLPPMFESRMLSLRAYDGRGMLMTARLAAPDEQDAAIRMLLAMPQVDYLHAHNAAYGCFAARIERDGVGR